MQDVVLYRDAFLPRSPGYAIGNPIKNGVYGYGATSGHALVGQCRRRCRRRPAFGSQRPRALEPCRVAFNGGSGSRATASKNVWACVANGSPGTWRKIAGPATAGRLHVLATPTALLRLAPGAATCRWRHQGRPLRRLATHGRHQEQQHRRSRRRHGRVGQPHRDGRERLPDSSLYSNSLGSWPGTSNINWDHNGLAIANMASSRSTAAARLKAYANADTHFLIDVIGYYQ